MKFFKVYPQSSDRSTKQLKTWTGIRFTYCLLQIFIHMQDLTFYKNFIEYGQQEGLLDIITKKESTTYSFHQ